jgi:hypothetical protein
MLRDSRINRIFEGSSEIMHLFIAREALDKHLEVAGPLIDPKLSFGEKLRVLPEVVRFYALWYPGLWLRALWTPRYSALGSLAPHARFAARAARRLARSLFHGMVRFGPKLERKQAFLFRAVDVALELFALSATIARAAGEGKRHARATELADQLAWSARRRISDLLRDMWRNQDVQGYHLARAVSEGQFVWLEQGTMGVPFSESELEPERMEDFFAHRDREREHGRGRGDEDGERGSRAAGAR